MGQCCDVIIMPKGGEIGPPGPPGEQGIQGIQGPVGVNGINGLVPVSQTLKFVKEFKPNNQQVPPFIHSIVITQGELSTAGMLKTPVWWNYGGFPTNATFKIRVFFYSTGFGFYQDIRYKLTPVVTLNSIIVDPGGNITVSILNDTTQIRDFRIEING